MQRIARHSLIVAQDGGFNCDRPAVGGSEANTVSTPIPIDGDTTRPGHLHKEHIVGIVIPGAQAPPGTQHDVRRCLESDDRRLQRRTHHDRPVRHARIATDIVRDNLHDRRVGVPEGQPLHEPAIAARVEVEVAQQGGDPVRLNHGEGGWQFGFRIQQIGHQIRCGVHIPRDTGDPPHAIAQARGGRIVGGVIPRLGREVHRLTLVDVIRCLANRVELDRFLRHQHRRLLGREVNRHQDVLVVVGEDRIRAGDIWESKAPIRGRNTVTIVVDTHTNHIGHGH